MTNEVNKTKGLSGSILKIIACVTMFIDHAGDALVNQALKGNAANFDAQGKLIHNGLYYLYHSMRAVGRIAFPIFIFMLIEGYFHTRDRWKYLIRVGIFAIIAEVPYDVSFNLTQRQMLEQKFIEFTDQNVFFTIFLGLFAVIVIDTIVGLNLDIMFKGVVILAFGIGMAGIGYLIKSDYDLIGVLAIEAAYIIRKAVKITEIEKDYPVRSNLAVALTISCTLLFVGADELYAFVTVPLLALYNGKRGSYMKYVFYIFYPLHLLILGLIKFIMFD